MLTGNLSETAFADLIQLYTLGRQTVAVTLVSPAGPDHDGIIFIENGELTDARLGEVTGADAVRRALRLTEGEFRVEINVRARHRTIHESWNKLVLEEMVAGDEASRPDDDVEIEQEESMLEKTQPPPAGRNRRVPIAVAAGILAAAAIGGAFIWRGQQQQREAADLAQRDATLAAQRAAEVRKAPARSVAGVTDTEIVFGMSAPFSGPAKELGRAMKSGIDVAFAAINESGGVNGRKLKLVALDDGYEPERTRTAMKELAEARNVFGFIGNVGTPTAEVSVPYALEKKMLFFGPFTGAGLLRRDPPDRYVFNYRASYAEETSAIFKYLVDVKRIAPEEIAVFAQQDGYGDAGFNGVAKMLRRYRRDPARMLRVGYQRNTSEVGDAVQALFKRKRPIRAVVMVATYKAAAKFIDKVKAERPDMIFTNVSFVGSQALSDELMATNPKDAEGVIVTQVVPLPQSKSTAVLRYQELLPKYSLGEKPDFVSLEGYLAANLLAEGLRKAGRDFTTETLVDALEGLKGVDLGVGAAMNFGMSEHQASHKIWGTQIDERGNFKNIELE
ncbi:MAG TPA: ABC transporter substrate-binding protein [Myxococcales bacterium]|nr:ABC transporter substrate-binding protein [Myxococcales bacterium]